MEGVVGYSWNHRDRGNTSGCGYRSKLCSYVFNKIYNKGYKGGYKEFV